MFETQIKVETFVQDVTYGSYETRLNAGQDAVSEVIRLRAEVQRLTAQAAGNAAATARTMPMLAEIRANVSRFVEERAVMLDPLEDLESRLRNVVRAATI